MSAQENDRIVRAYFEQPTADAYAPDALLHDISQPQPLRGRDSIRAFLEMYLGEAFPEGAYELHRVVAGEEAVAVEWTFRGTNSGPLMGAEPTGRAVEFSGVSVYEMRDGLFAAARIYYDTGTLADQLGLQGARIPSTERERWAEWWARQR